MVSHYKPTKNLMFSLVDRLAKINDWEFKQRGQSGMWISDLFPHITTVADERQL